jgi:hypothetical protein
LRESLVERASRRQLILSSRDLRRQILKERRKTQLLSVLKWSASISGSCIMKYIAKN